MIEKRKEETMTEKGSLEKALVLWKKIEERGFNNKYEAYMELDLSLDYHECPACQFAIKTAYGKGAIEGSFTSDCCSHCPIWEWQEGGYMCERVASSYRNWYICHSPENAGKMVKLIEQVIATGEKEVTKGELS